MNGSDHFRVTAPAALALALALTGAVAPVAAQMPPLTVAVRVEEPAGVRRVQAPVHVNVPLPLDAPSDPAVFRLLDANGIEVPADRWAVARWHGSREETTLPIRWLGLSFAVDSAAGEVRHFTLTTGAPRDEDAPLLARNEEDGVYLETGAVSLRLPHSGTSLLDNLWIDLDGSPGVDAEMITAEHAGGLLIPNDGSSTARWATHSARIVHNGRRRAVARVDLLAERAELGSAVLWVEVQTGQPTIRLTLLARPGDTQMPSSPISLVLPVRTLGDPLQLGVRRGLQDDILEGPLPTDATLFVEPTDEGWHARLGATRAGGVMAWGQMSTLMWSTAIAADTSMPLRGLRIAGNGALWFDLQPDAATGATTASLLLDARRRVGATTAIADFAAPLVTTIAADWYRTSQALGPLPFLGSASVVAPTPLISATLGFVATGSADELSRARNAARTELLAPTAAGLRGLSLYALLTGDPAADEAARERAAGYRGPALRGGTTPLDALTAWEITGDPRFLEQGREALRTGIGTAWAADACVSAAQDPGSIAELLAATAHYVWTLRSQAQIDHAAENALFGMLDRLETCPPADARWADTWAYGALLAADGGRRERWTALAGTDAARRGQ